MVLGGLFKTPKAPDEILDEYEPEHPGDWPDEITGPYHQSNPGFQPENLPEPEEPEDEFSYRILLDNGMTYYVHAVDIYTDDKSETTMVFGFFTEDADQYMVQWRTYTLSMAEDEENVVEDVTISVDGVGNFDGGSRQFAVLDSSMALEFLTKISNKYDV